MAEIETIISIALGVVAIAGVGYGLAKGQFKSETKYEKRFQEQGIVLESLKVKLDVLWKIFEEQLPKLMVRPDHREMDELIKKYVDKKATKEELIKLREMINEELENGTDPITQLKLSFMKPVLEHNIGHFK